jgi:signal transduction histidine kinase/ActR/RegA family two-component response regulator
VRIFTGQRLLLFTFAILFAIWLGDFVLQQSTLREMYRAQTKIRDLEHARAVLRDLILAYVNAETGQRGYLLTGQDSYLAPYHEARVKLDALSKELMSAFGTSSELDEITKKGQEKLAELQRSIQTYQQQGREAALGIVRTGLGKNLMDEIRESAAGLDLRLAEESRRIRGLIGRKGRQVEGISIAMKSIMGIALAGILVVLLRTFRQREAAYSSERKSRLETQKALAAERAAHSEATRANRLKDEFLAVVSHELRTPLTAILGWVTLLQQGAEDEREKQEGLDSIERNVRAQKRLVEDLLDVSRIVTGKLRLQFREVNLLEVLDAVLEGLQPSAEAKGLQLQRTWTGEAAEVLGDFDRLQQIIWNLLSNAIKFTSRGGRVTATVSRIESVVELSVRDTGQGIKPEFLPLIFERFTQQETGTTRSRMGLGLGLAITRHLVEMHGGRIWVESAGEGQGSTFHVQIPVLAAREPSEQVAELTGAEATAEGQPTEVKAADLQGARILAVDDQADTLAVISRVLARAGAEVRTAESVPEAWDVLESWRPNLLLSDIGMPGEDGYSFIRRVRNRSAGENIPAIALTAFAKTEDYQRAIQAGFNDHLAKPVDANLLTSKLAEVLRQSQEANRP